MGDGNATIEVTASHMNGLRRSVHSSVGTSIDTTIRMPPIVGVPAFF